MEGASMRIGIVSPRYIDQDMRGGEEIPKTLAITLSKDNDVIVLTSDAYDLRAEHLFFGKRHQSRLETDGNVLVERYHSFSFAGTFLYVIDRVVFRRLSKGNPRLYSNILADLIRIHGWGPLTLEIYGRITGGNFDVIHSFVYPTYTSFISLIASKAAGVPFVFTPFYHFRDNSVKNSRLFRYMIRNSDALIACTNMERDELINIGSDPDSTHVIQPGFDMNLAKVSQLISNNFADDLGLRGNHVVLMHPWSTKGAIEMLDAIDALLERRSDFAILTIGEPDGEYLSKKKELLRRHKFANIIDFGWVSGAKKWAVLSLCDVFVMMSFNDAFGLSYINAWSLGKPIIGARGSFAEDIIKNGIDGLLIDIADKAEASKAIEYLFDNPSIRNEIGRNGKLKVANYLSNTRFAKEMTNVYSALIK